MLFHMDFLVVAMELKASMVVFQWCFLLNNTWWWMLLEANFFPSMRISQGISCVTFLWVCFLFSSMWISITCLFQIYYGLCGNSYIICCKFPYKWYQSYGFIVITLDWIHRNAWEDKREGKIYDFFITDLRVLDFMLWWDVEILWACEIVSQKGFSEVSFKWVF